MAVLYNSVHFSLLILLLRMIRKVGLGIFKFTGNHFWLFWPTYYYNYVGTGRKLNKQGIASDTIPSHCTILLTGLIARWILIS